MIKLFERNGWNNVDSYDDADVIVLNSCSVRQRAEDKVLGLGRRIASLKKSRPNLTVVLTGCMAQRITREGCEEEFDEKYTKKLRRKMPWVDVIVEIGELSRLAEVVLAEKHGIEYDNAPQSHLSEYSADVPISKGCDNFCTYCVVPFTRGKEVHRSYDEIMKQAWSLINSSYSYVTLLGQNVNSWKGIREGENISFADLLIDVASLEGGYWLTFLTSHPKDFTKSLAEAFKSQNVCPYLNLPVQSGSDSVLQAMNRKYTRKEYLQKIHMLKEIIPDIRLSTDIIVGFPGELADDFKKTLSLLEEVEYGMVYIAEYSARPIAASSRLKDDVPAEVKKKRRETVDSLQRNIIKKLNERAVGTKMKMLITGNHSGRAQDLREVRLEEDMKLPLGSFADVEITAGTVSGLLGRIAV